MVIRDLRDSLINRLIYFLPVDVISYRHYYNNKRGLECWLNDDPFMFHVPKTGGTSIAKALGRPEPGHQTYKHLVASYPELKFKKNYFFVWRDPVDRIESTYRYVMGLHEKYGTSNLPQVFYSRDINDFVKNYLPSMMVKRHYFLRPVSMIVEGVAVEKLWAINFNELSVAYRNFMTKMGRDVDALSHENKSSDLRRSSSRLDQHSIGLINKIYADDLAIGSMLGDKEFVNLADLKRS